MQTKRILILGGYGNFGRRIAEALASQDNLKIFIAGRDLNRSHACCDALSPNVHAILEAVCLNADSPDFAHHLASLDVDVVINCVGPFQAQDYRIAIACISCQCHYIDLADDRQFVCNFTSLDELAKRNNVIAVSGASTVPGLSSVVIDHFYPDFNHLETIDFAIAPGNKAERGLATVTGILSAIGHTFPVLSNSEWSNRYGWMSPRKWDFGEPVGHRWLANINIPDLELFPQRYPDVTSVNFQAGLELPLLHWTMVVMAAMAKIGLIRNWRNFSKPIFYTGEWFRRFGSDDGGMQIRLSGTDHADRRKEIRWTLRVLNGVGPYIPTLPAVILTRKLVANDIAFRGATPCLGMFSLADFDREASQFDISHQTHTIDG